MATGKVLGDYMIAPSVDDEINYNSGDRRYMVVRTERDGDVYGRGDDAVTFTNDLRRAHSDADWSGTSGRGAIVVDLARLLRLPWDQLPVIYDNEDEG